jgi:hypothetical protein
MKFSDLEPGIEVTFNESSIDKERWRKLNEASMSSNSRYQNIDQWYNFRYKSFENVPIKIVTLAPAGGRSQNRPMMLTGTTTIGDIQISENWFDPKNDYAFKRIVPTQSEELRDEIKKKPAKVAKNVVLGELKAVPGAVDYNKTEESFGKGRRKTRRGRKNRRRTTRKR